ncbi:Uncharacterised protein [Mycobacteroides abscessus]|nr:Uncharacterised protein [Mycobacteroides abscessus]CPS57285.1 Uncharacterised protein [Mycobacteroides abscessus]CPY45913.1 Uncharacterised protein [Mycobacteroides abscessus]
MFSPAAINHDPASAKNDWIFPGHEPISAMICDPPLTIADTTLVIADETADTIPFQAPDAADWIEDHMFEKNETAFWKNVTTAFHESFRPCQTLDHGTALNIDVIVLTSHAGSNAFRNDVLNPSHAFCPVLPFCWTLGSPLRSPVIDDRAPVAFIRGAARAESCSSRVNVLSRIGHRPSIAVFRSLKNRTTLAAFSGLDIQSNPLRNKSPTADPKDFKESPRPFIARSNCESPDPSTLVILSTQVSTRLAQLLNDWAIPGSFLENSVLSVSIAAVKSRMPGLAWPRASPMFLNIVLIWSRPLADVSALTKPSVIPTRPWAIAPNPSCRAGIIASSFVNTGVNPVSKTLETESCIFANCSPGLSLPFLSKTAHPELTRACLMPSIPINTAPSGATIALRMPGSATSAPDMRPIAGTASDAAAAIATIETPNGRAVAID